MYNLLVSGNQETWERCPTEFPRDRVIKSREYTVDEIADKYASLNDDNVEIIKGFPCIFLYEGVQGFFRVGYINDIRLRSENIIIIFEYDQIFPPLPVQKLFENKLAFDIYYDFEFSRTHWALKDVDLFQELVKHGFVTQEQVNASLEYRSPTAAVSTTNGESIKNSVFIVHGHDELSKTETARFVESLGLNVTILHEQTSSSKTIIEKFERHASEAAFAIVLLTPDDVGYAKDSPNNAKYRARQNVVFELGYFCSALSREKVCVLYKEGVEIPNDFSGVVYTPMDSAGAWKLSLAREMKASGLNVDLNRAL
ncbi:MAG: DNA-binding protein [Sphingobium sp.]|uniref:TIR domain-containing protein n=1 Tax=Marinobacter sp. NP-4(2019) TaxID=2488665 RepID=UPI000C0DBC30|nr:nucleotide-binding protein [Marinobacter sp. NP-4(2019)]AZT83956.1 DNA-binding protein [Marinobacter sp. NP-4(2019)]PHQ63611.1 MAG: DNA-binding protein [Sphingobium sp.]